MIRLVHSAISLKFPTECLISHECFSFEKENLSRDHSWHTIKTRELNGLTSHQLAGCTWSDSTSISECIISVL